MEMMDKKLSFTLSSYHFIIIAIVAFMMISSVSVAVAELPYEKQVKFVSAVEQTNGHIIGARENIVAGNYEIASLHLTHPTEELYDDLHAESKSNSQINQKIEYGLFILKHTDPNVDLDYFDKQTDEIIKILHDAKIALISKETLNDSVFKLDVISDLLEISKMQYKNAMDSNDELSKIIDFEDSHVFVMRAEHVLSTIADMEPGQKNKLALKLQQTQLNILNRQSLNDVSIEFENIVNDVGVIEKNGLGFETAIIALGGLGIGEPGIIGNDGLVSQETQNDSIVIGESFIPTWVKLNAVWWTDDLVTDEEFLSGIEYLIEQKILVVSVVQAPIDSADNKIPSWIKNRTGWWADGMVSDTEFLSGIEYMIERGILVV